jgi:hypothetical protein
MDYSISNNHSWLGGGWGGYIWIMLPWDLLENRTDHDAEAKCGAYFTHVMHEFAHMAQASGQHIECSCCFFINLGLHVCF